MKALIEVEVQPAPSPPTKEQWCNTDMAITQTGILVADQRLLFQGRELSNSAKISGMLNIFIILLVLLGCQMTLNSYGVVAGSFPSETGLSNDDLLLLERRTQQISTNSTAPQRLVNPLIATLSY